VAPVAVGDPVIQEAAYTGLGAQPRVIVVRDRWYRLDESWAYHWEHEGRQVRLRAAASFEFDGASIPWIAQPIIGGRWALGIEPPMWHDALYRCGGDLERAVFGIHKDESPESLARAGDRYLWHEVLLPDAGLWEPVGHVWSRSEADRLFGRQMREAGVGVRRRRMAYRAVRLGGRWSWRGP
jgi:hypothetical protein